MELGVLFSGGKDSCLATQKAIEHGNLVKCLISIVSKNMDSWMFHTPNIELVKEQADAIGIPLLRLESEGVKEQELDDLKKAIKLAIEKYGIKGIVTGAIQSTYQSSRIQRIAKELKIECFNPLWLSEQEDILKEIVKKGFKAIITRVAGEGIDKKFIVRVIDEKFIEDILRVRDKYKINVAGEGGEMESFVLDAPFFKFRLEVVNADIAKDGQSYTYSIKKLKIARK